MSRRPTSRSWLIEIENSQRVLSKIFIQLDLNELQSLKFYTGAVEYNFKYTNKINTNYKLLRLQVTTEI